MTRNTNGENEGDGQVLARTCERKQSSIDHEGTPVLAGGRQSSYGSCDSRTGSGLPTKAPAAGYVTKYRLGSNMFDFGRVTYVWFMALSLKIWKRLSHKNVPRLVFSKTCIHSLPRFTTYCRHAKPNEDRQDAPLNPSQVGFEPSCSAQAVIDKSEAPKGLDANHQRILHHQNPYQTETVFSLFGLDKLTSKTCLITDTEMESLDLMTKLTRGKTPVTSSENDLADLPCENDGWPSLQSCSVSGYLAEMSRVCANGTPETI